MTSKLEIGPPCPCCKCEDTTRERNYGRAIKDGRWWCMKCGHLWHPAANNDVGLPAAGPNALKNSLTRRQRQMLRDAYEHMQAKGGKVGKWVTLMSPCPRSGDLRVLNGLALRGFMTDGDHDDTPHSITVWPRWIRITAAGAKEWERILAERRNAANRVIGTPVAPCQDLEDREK